MDKKPSHDESGKFKQGIKVRILEGPFKEFRGKITQINQDTHKLVTAVNFFGKEVQAELDFSQIAPDL